MNDTVMAKIVCSVLVIVVLGIFAALFGRHLFPQWEMQIVTMFAFYAGACVMRIYDYDPQLHKTRRRGL